MFFTADAQDIVAQWNNKCDKEERSCLAAGGTSSMAPYWRKAKDHLLRICGVYHLGGLAVKLIESAQLSPSTKVRPRHLLKLVSHAVEMPHVDGRYVVTGEGVSSCPANASLERKMEGSLAHLIDATAVNMARLVLEQHMALAGAVHGAAVNRCAVLFGAKGYLVTSADAHAGLLGQRIDSDTFSDMAKASMRAGVGVYLALEPTKWKPSGKDVAKTGGHVIHVFIKRPVGPLDSMTDLRRRVMQKVCVLPNGTLDSVLSKYYVDIVPQDAGQKHSAAVEARLKMPAKVMMSAASVAKRVDVIAPGEDGDGCSSYRAAFANCTSCWTDPKAMEDAHAHIWQLAVLAAQIVDHQKGTGALTDNIALLDEPEIPGPSAAHKDAEPAQHS